MYTVFSWFEELKKKVVHLADGLQHHCRSAPHAGSAEQLMEETAQAIDACHVFVCCLSQVRGHISHTYTHSLSFSFLFK